MNFRWWPWKREKPAHLRAGEWGEEQAAKHLTGKGYRILGRRVRVGRHDELDIVARHGAVLVFVEVKTRKGENFGRPLASVTRAKQHALSRAAIGYMKPLREKPAYFRFDVVEIVGSEDSTGTIIRHIENAFTLSRGYRISW